MINVHVRGLDGFQHDLKVAEERLVTGVRDLMSELAADSAQDARRRAKRGEKTGRSGGSIVARGPVLRAGDDVPWYGFADFGGKVGKNRSIHRRYIKSGRWLFPAVKDVGVIRRSEEVADKATKELQ